MKEVEDENALKHIGNAFARIVKKEPLYFFPASFPGSLRQDKAAIGGHSVESP